MSDNGAIKVGDVVRFNLSGTKAAGRVTEDRGPIGYEGRRMFRVAYSLGADFSNETDMPAENLTVARRGGRTEPGDVVRFMLGRTLVTGRVTEERGRIGTRKRRLYRIAYVLGNGFSAETELPEGDFDVAWDETMAT
jgi:hypothetical protein